MNRTPLAFCAVLGMSSLAAPAVAQTTNGEGGAITSSSMLKSRQTRTFAADLTAQAAHDSNLSRASKSTAALRGVQASDWTYTPSASVSLIQPLGRQALFLDATAGYRFHDKNKQLDRVTYAGSGGAGFSVGPCGAVALGSYSQSASETDTDIVDVFVQNVRKNRSVGASMTCMQPSGLGVTGGVSRSWVTSNLAQARISDHDTSAANVGVLYGRPEIAAVTLVGSYTRTLYPNRLTVDATRNGFEATAGGVQIARKLGARIEATATFGYTAVSPIGGRLISATALAPSKFHGITYAGDVSYRASSRLQVGAQFQRSVSPSFVSTGSFQVRTGYGANLTYKVGSRIVVDLQAQNDDVDIKGVGVSTIASTLTNSNTKVGGVSVAYKQSERLTFRLSAEREKRSSDNSLFNYTNDRVVISTSLAF